MRQVVQKALACEAGADADAKVVAAAALRLYSTLAQHFAPLIGDGGVTALMHRSVHLTQRDFPWLADTGNPDQPVSPLSEVSLCLGRQEPVAAGQAVVALFETFGNLLAKMIGEPLTTRLLRQAWPTGFSDEASQETQR